MIGVERDGIEQSTFLRLSGPVGNQDERFWWSS